jgi:hypothetical protein
MVFFKDSAAWPAICSMANNLLRHLSPATLQLRHCCGDHGHILPGHIQQAQHSLREVLRLPCQRSTKQNRYCSPADQRLDDVRKPRKLSPSHFGIWASSAQASLRNVMNVTQFCAK